MTTGARVVRAADAGNAVAVTRHGPAPGLSVAQRRRIAREQIAGHLEAERLIAAARRSAGDLVTRASIAAEHLGKDAARDAREAEQAKVAALYLALRAAEDTRAERELDRAIALAVALAERLLGAALEIDPSRITALARQALAEARGARRAVIEAHPLDADALAKSPSTLGLAEGAVEIRAKEGLARGELCLHTDLGTLDAKLTPQLERLAAALRDALR